MNDLMSPRPTVELKMGDKVFGIDDENIKFSGIVFRVWPDGIHATIARDDRKKGAGDFTGCSYGWLIMKRNDGTWSSDVIYGTEAFGQITTMQLSKKRFLFCKMKRI
jgi:hypothetical protein